MNDSERSTGVELMKGLSNISRRSGPDKESVKTLFYAAECECVMRLLPSEHGFFSLS